MHNIFGAALAQIQRPSFLGCERHRSDLDRPMDSTAKELREAILAALRLVNKPVSESWLVGATDGSRTRVRPALEDLEKRGLIRRFVVCERGEAFLWGANRD